MSLEHSKPQEKVIEMPSPLDLVCIDGRWGQVISTSLSNASIIWLDGKTAISEDIDLRKYYMDTEGHPAFIDRADLPEDQIKKIHVKHDSRLEHTRIFGIYSTVH